MGAPVTDRAQPIGWQLHLEKASHYNGSRQFSMAQREARAGLASDPHNPWLHFELARSELGLEDLASAESTCRAGLQGNASHAPLHGLLGLVLMDQGKNKESEASLLEGLRLHPDSAWLYLQYARLMMKTAHLDRAQLLIDKALEINPESEDAHALASLLQSHRNQTARSKRSGRISLKLAPEEDVSHYAMGHALLNGGHPFKAREHFREALRIDPSDSDLEEAYLEADKCCRVVYLPMYFFSLVMHRLPGRQFALWALFVAFTMIASGSGMSGGLLGTITLLYVGFAIYTWIADPLAKRWIKRFPPE